MMVFDKLSKHSPKYPQLRKDFTMTNNNLQQEPFPLSHGLTDRKYTPHPGWGDKQPPAAKNRTEWDKYKSLYPGFAVDVFHQGEHIGTYKLSDARRFIR